MLTKEIDGTAIRNTTPGILNLTDIWRQAGANESQRPSTWIITKDGIRVIEYVRNRYGCTRGDIYYASAGVNGGTWADWIVAGYYAEAIGAEIFPPVDDQDRARWTVIQNAKLNRIGESPGGIRRRSFNPISLPYPENH